MEGVRHTRYGWWLEEAGPVEATAPLAGDTTADVVIVGGGYLGLWTAWQLKELEPSLDVVVLEAGLAGHGPSGRNGGFVSTLWDDVPILRDRVGDERALAVARASDRGVHGIGEWCERTGRRRLVPRRSHALRRDERGAARLLRRRDRGVRRPRRPRGDPPDRSRASCAAAATPASSAARSSGRPRRSTLRGSRSAFARRRSRRASASTSGRPSGTCSADAVAVTPLGRVRAGAAVLAVNSATVGFQGFRLSHAVASSHMVVTEPVPDVIEELGWTGGEAIADGRTLLHYLRTTRDGRIAFGWGGGRMGFGARHLARLDVDPGAARTARDDLLRFFPQLRGRRITNAWGGPIDVSPTHLPIFGSRGRVHHGFGFTGQRRRAVLPRRRDPRPARPRPPRRADPARDRRAVAEADAARAVPLGGRLRDPRRARPVGRGRGRRHGARTP